MTRQEYIDHFVLLFVRDDRDTGIGAKRSPGTARLWLLRKRAHKNGGPQP